MYIKKIIQKNEDMKSFKFFISSFFSPINIIIITFIIHSNQNLIVIIQYYFII